jgi:hypothetical protein
MNQSRNKLEKASAIISAVLSEQITPEKNPMLFDEDVVMFSICLVEAENPTWLLAQIADPHYPLSGRLTVLNYLRNLYHDALVILRREDPNLNQF